ncbi:related to NADP-dependent alcohol dehydrogenase 7 [Saccharomycodes ludwigii]|uniref:Related to NADP-dependent alcohol dehydrogenase 7 n=1 Tax=Saccharomycodes ludwigii TaxID=36035 RepID=A0A376B764_9ASCO|nr:related to NADP-dependent alcohol dehydrogenase 7 [Saccharomycodes ludwigii]
MDKETTFKALGVADDKDWIHPKRFGYHPTVLNDHDVEVEIELCAVCGSDLHYASGDWGRPFLPAAPGPEIIGKISKMGKLVDANKFKMGDRVGVGPQKDCCGKCTRCLVHKEMNCKKMIQTYSSPDPITGEGTQGGYADRIRCNDRFIFKIPDNLESKYAAPLMCGGMTGFKPLLTAKVGKGTKVGIVGIGGIGHMTILFAKALGAEVTAISRSDRKREDAFKLGADHYITTSKDGYTDEFSDSLDLIIYTTSSFSGVNFDENLKLLMPGGKIIFITAPPLSEKLTLSPFAMLMGDYSVGASAVGHPHEIEFMLKFAAEHNIKPWVETLDINADNVTEAWERLERGDVKYRFVLTNNQKYFASNKDETA